MRHRQQVSLVLAGKGDQTAEEGDTRQLLRVEEVEVGEEETQPAAAAAASSSSLYLME